jgi:hypothetical protein
MCLISFPYRITNHSDPIEKHEDLKNKSQSLHFEATCNTVKTDIVFLKTHKCSSSSIQNFLLRYARQYELTVVLPKVNTLVA